MNKANLYQHSNELQRQDAKQILDEFSYLFRWRNDTTDTLLDIGCGTGDVTFDYILPLLPNKFIKIVGCDKSEEMLRYARKKFQHPCITFIQMDINEELNKNLYEFNVFDHVTSFYCLHWVQNQKIALKNIFNLLRDDGDCLLVFLASNPIFDIYEEMSKTNKWREYMLNVNSYISPYQFSTNPSVEFGNHMCDAGFSDVQVEVREKIFVYEGIENLKKSVKAVNPFKIPKNFRDEFLDDYVKIATKNNLSDGEQFITPYKLMIGYGKK